MVTFARLHLLSYKKKIGEVILPYSDISYEIKFQLPVSVKSA